MTRKRIKKRSPTTGPDRLRRINLSFALAFVTLITLYDMLAVKLMLADGEPTSHIVGFVIFTMILCGGLCWYMLVRGRSTIDAQCTAADDIDRLTRFIHLVNFRMKLYEQYWEGHRVRLRVDLPRPFRGDTLAAGTWGTIVDMQINPDAPFTVRFDGGKGMNIPDLGELDLHPIPDTAEQDARKVT